MKKYAIVFLSLFLVVSLPFAAHANIVTATGKYLINAVKKIPGGAKVEATNTVTGAKHVIKHGVSSADLGKSIGAGIVGFGVGTGAGLAFKAITGLALDAVDWVMDPANNSIKWKEKGEGAIGSDAQAGYSWTVNNVAPLIKLPTPAAVAAELEKRAFSSTGSDFVSAKRVSFKRTNSTTYTLALEVVRTGGTYKPFYEIIRVDDPNQKETGTPSSDYKSLPLVDLAKKTLELADGGDVDAQKAVEDHVTHRAQNGDLDNELDNATDITEPENPEEPKECPSGSVKVDDVCVKIPDSDGDEPLFCDSSEFTKKVCDWIDWTQAEPEEVTPEQIDIKEVEADNSNKIDMSGECPAPYQLNFSISGYAQNHSISYEPLCNALILLKPIFVGSGALSGMFILMGYSRASNTGVNG